jgi:hypothetical protein
MDQLDTINQSQTKSRKRLEPEIELFEAACMYAQTQIAIRKAQEKCDFEEFESVDAIIKIAMEIGVKFEKAKLAAPFI